MLKVTIKELISSFEYFEPIQVSKNVKMFIHDIKTSNTRHYIYHYTIRYILLGQRFYITGFGSFDDVNRELYELNIKILLWRGDI